MHGLIQLPFRNRVITREAAEKAAQGQVGPRGVQEVAGKEGKGYLRDQAVRR